MLRLEKIIGQKVFSRTRGGVKLTRHGEMLVPYANRALELNEEALARLREESASGPVRLGVSEDTALAGLTPALKRFQSSHPEVLLEIFVAGPAKLICYWQRESLILSSVIRAQLPPSPLWNAKPALSGSQARSCPLILSGLCRSCYGTVQA